MSLNFANVKSIVIPDGNVKKLTIGGVDVWSSAPPTPPAPPEWQALFDSINAGTYKTDYAIGDLIPLDLGTEGAIHMQIAGFDCDELAAGGNFAAVSLVSKELLNTNHIMNEYTSAATNWNNSAMMTYLKNTIKPLIPNGVSGSIVEVKKTSIAYDTSGSAFEQDTLDELWIPSVREIAYSGKKETSGAIYESLFSDSQRTTRVKVKIGSGNTERWFVRSADGIYAFSVVSTTGDIRATYTHYEMGVALGFCIGVGAPLPSASLLLSTMTRPTAYNPTLDSGDDISDAEALSIITGGEYR